MSELKKCPFCGGAAAQREFTEPFVNGWVGCQKCHCFIEWVKGGKQSAVAAWNRRPQPEDGESETIKRIEEVMTIVKTQHMIQSLDGDCCGQDVSDYRDRFAALKLCISILASRPESNSLTKEAPNEQG